MSSQPTLNGLINDYEYDYEYEYLCVPAQRVKPAPRSLKTPDSVPPKKIKNKNRCWNLKKSKWKWKWKF